MLNATKGKDSFPRCQGMTGRVVFRAYVTLEQMNRLKISKVSGDGNRDELQGRMNACCSSSRLTENVTLKLS